MQIEQEIIAKCIENDRRSQSRLYNECFDFLMKICIRYEKNEDDAAAMVNQGFLKILVNLKSYKYGTSFSAWIRRIMINTLINEYWKNKKMKDLMTSVDYSDYKYENESSNYNLYEENIAVDEVMAYVDTLPPMSKVVFNLYVFDGYKHKEIAETLNISAGTSKWHLSTARKMLQDRYNNNLKLVI